MKKLEFTDNTENSNVDFDTDENSFDTVIPAESINIFSHASNVINIHSVVDKNFLPLSSNNEFHKLIHKAIASSFNTSWFMELNLNSKIASIRKINQFIKWMNEIDKERSASNKYECLNDYATFRIEKVGVKHSDSARIKGIINNAITNVEFEKSEFLFLRHLVKATRKTLSAPAQSFTMSDWFSIPWLRNILGEKKYLQLESPSRLHLSFRITIATTLLYLLEAREVWYEKIKNPPTKHDHPLWHGKWVSEILKQAATFNLDGTPADVLTNCLWQDFSRTSKYDFLKQQIATHGLSKLTTTVSNWLSPSVFTPDYHEAYSRVEERLAAWLIACEAVQPSDINNIRTTDYALEFSSNGRLLFMQCLYHKGRSGNFKYPKMLMGNDCWTKALHGYIKRVEKGEKLFKMDTSSAISIPILGEASKLNTPFNFLYKLWGSADLQNRILAELARAKASPIFLDAILCLDQATKSFFSINSLTRKGRLEYESSVPNPAPSYLFKLTHIKNTAVHAGSDNYRESDLINHHSHSSKTEKHSYLTDKNKDWVNRCGRVTRMVLHDLQSVVYQPVIDVIRDTVDRFDSKTIVIDGDDLPPKDGYATDDLFIDNFDEHDSIIVMDTIDTSLYFIHYITQAEANLPRLLKSRPDFVERTLIAKVEWMTRTLQRMVSAKSANEKYPLYAPHLPEIFAYLLETIE